LAPLDWVILGLLAASVLLGLWRGLVYEVLSVLSWVAAFVLAQWLAPATGEWLPLDGWSQALRYAAGFVLVFVGILFAGGLVAWLTKKLVEAVGLRPMDRALGGLFGLVRGALFVLAAALVVHLVGLDEGAWWKESVAAGVATTALRGLKPVVPGELGSFLPA
jgi:membrane protein required for colicin V production